MTDENNEGQLVISDETLRSIWTQDVADLQDEFGPLQAYLMPADLKTIDPKTYADERGHLDQAAYSAWKRAVKETRKAAESRAAGKGDKASAKVTKAVQLAQAHRDGKLTDKQFIEQTQKLTSTR